MPGPFVCRAREGIEVAGPAVGLVETSSIARGIVVADAMVKRAPVRLALSRPVTPGKHLVIVTGEVAEVEEAMKVGAEIAGHTLLDRLFLPQAHARLLAALHRGCAPERIDALGIVETSSVASTLLAADAACKAAEADLVELRLADGLGGKAYFVLTTSLDLVEAAVAAAEALAAGHLISREIIAAPHDDVSATFPSTT